LTNLVPIDEHSINWIFQPMEAFLIGLGLYLATLVLIWLQNRLVSPHSPFRQYLQTIVNVELLACLSIYQFFLGGFRIFSEQPFETLSLVFLLGLYFGGLIFFKATSRGKKEYADILLIMPFAIPFLLLVFLFDLLKFFPSEDLHRIIMGESNTFLDNVALYSGIIIYLVILMAILPYLIQKIWNCKPLKNAMLEEKLSELCKKAKFKHSGFKNWTILKHSSTAAIIGVMPSCRYILFTDRLLREVPPDSVEAILAHEIGHNYHRHLLAYPFVIFGLSLLLTVVSWYFSPWLAKLLFLGNATYPGAVWNWAFPFALFFSYAIIVMLYFRYIFGFFSRLFERQADLHVFKLGIPAQHMIQALDHIGISTGNTHNVPNWHHYSIQQRMNFLKSAEKHPTLILKHHRKVKIFLSLYLVLLVLSIILLIIL